jgi:polar amino acid transport system substrate-binding protein
MKIISRFSLFAVIYLTLILTACGVSESTAGELDNEEGKKTLRVVTHAAYAPFEYLQGDGIKGFDIDFVRAAAEKAGYTVKIEHVGWESLFNEIENRKADFAVSAITINADRKQTYDFSAPYFLSTNKILVPEDSEIISGEDLKGKVVAVQNGTTGLEKIETILGENNPDILKFENNNLAIQEMLNGRADAVVADNIVLEEYVNNNPNRNVKIITDKSFEKESYGFLFPKGSELRPEMDRAIKDILANGTYTKTYMEWFETKPDIKQLKEL